MHHLRRPSILATLVVLLAMVVAGVVIATTAARIDAFAPVIIFSVAFATVLALVMPGGASRR